MLLILLSIIVEQIEKRGELFAFLGVNGAGKEIK